MPWTLAWVGLAFWLWAKWRPGMRRSRRIVGLLMGCWLVLASVPVLGNLWIKSLEGKPVSVADQVASLGPMDAVVVPGSGGPGVNSSKAVQHLSGYVRVMAGVETWKKTGGMLILMGGMAKTPEDSLAAAMRDMAMSMGVPADSIRIVADSRTTQEDMRGAARILAGSFPAEAGQAMAGTEPGGKIGGISANARIALVTSASHMQRTLATAQQLGFKPTPIRCDFRQIANPGWRAWLPNNGAPWQFRQALHETVGLLVYRLRGWAD